MLFSGKENIFKCFVAFQKMFWKIFSGVWLCSWKYHRKHIFYLLLTFSHIFSAAKQIYNIIHSSVQKHKQNPEKNIIKSGQIERRRKRERWLGLARRWDRDRCEGKIVIGAKARSRLVRCCDDQTRFKREREIKKERDRRHELNGTMSLLRLRLGHCVCESFFLSLFLPLRVCELFSLRVSVPEVI